MANESIVAIVIFCSRDMRDCKIKMPKEISHILLLNGKYDNPLIYRAYQD